MNLHHTVFKVLYYKCQIEILRQHPQFPTSQKLRADLLALPKLEDLILFAAMMLLATFLVKLVPDVL